MARHTRSTTRKGNASPLANGDEVLKDGRRRKHKKATPVKAKKGAVAKAKLNDSSAESVDEARLQLQREMAAQEVLASAQAAFQAAGQAGSEISDQRSVRSLSPKPSELDEEATAGPSHQHGDGAGAALEIGIIDENSQRTGTETLPTSEDVLEIPQYDQEEIIPLQVEVGDDIPEALVGLDPGLELELELEAAPQSSATSEHGALVEAEPQLEPTPPLSPQRAGSAQTKPKPELEVSSQPPLELDAGAPSGTEHQLEVTPPSPVEPDAGAPTELGAAEDQEELEAPEELHAVTKPVYWVPPSFEEQLAAIGLAQNRKRKADYASLRETPEKRSRVATDPNQSDDDNVQGPSTEPQPLRRIHLQEPSRSKTPSLRTRRKRLGYIDRKSKGIASTANPAHTPEGKASMPSLFLDDTGDKENAPPRESHSPSDVALQSQAQTPTVQTPRTTVWTAARDLFTSFSSPFRRAPTQITLSPSKGSAATEPALYEEEDDERRATGATTSPNITGDLPIFEDSKHAAALTALDSFNPASVPRLPPPHQHDRPEKTLTTEEFDQTKHSAVANPFASPGPFGLNVIPEETSSLISFFNSPERASPKTPLRASSLSAGRSRSSSRTRRTPASKDTLGSARAAFEASTNRQRASLRRVDEEDEEDGGVEAMKELTYKTPTDLDRSDQSRKRSMTSRYLRPFSTPQGKATSDGSSQVLRSGNPSSTSKICRTSNLRFSVENSPPEEVMNTGAMPSTTPTPHTHGGFSKEQLKMLRKTGYIPGTPTVGATFGVPEDSDSDSSPGGSLTGDQSSALSTRANTPDITTDVPVIKDILEMTVPKLSDLCQDYHHVWSGKGAKELALSICEQEGIF